MSENKMFSEEFREKMFGEAGMLGDYVKHSLRGIFQNPIPITKEEIEHYNSNVDSIIDSLQCIKKKVNDEVENDKLVPFNY